MNFSELRPFSIEMAEIYYKHYAQSKTMLADACFNSRIAWEPGFYYRWEIVADCFLSISDGGVFTQPHMYLPLGDLTQEKLQISIDWAAKIFEQHNWQLVIMFIDEEYLDLFSQIEGYEQILEFDEGFSDYIYDAKSLRTLKGRDYRSKRNHVNRFLRDNYDWEYKTLSASDANAAIELTRTWCLDQEVDCCDIKQSDLPAIKHLFDNFDALKIFGGAIYSGDNLIAFSMGSKPREGYGVIHFEKAHPDYDGLYAVINQSVMQNEYADITLINREEDMGIEGIRQAKESYVPKTKFKKYKITLNKI